jgi:polyhydroxyalkanoate synthase subunit PhaC
MQNSFEIIQRLRDGLERMRGPDRIETGCSPRTAVWRDGKRVLYRYEPTCARRVRTPLLICYALVNRPYMMDLQSDRSMIRALLDSGIDVYLIDWGYPDAGDRFADLNGYINETLDDCLEHLKRTHGVQSVNLLGVCQGGTLSVCYSASHPDKVKNLVTMVTPVDFKTSDNLLSKWAQSVDVEAMTRSGNISGDFLNFVYLSLMPFRLTQQKYLVLAELAQDPSQLEYFARMERWIFDSPDQAAQAFSEFLTWFFKENRLIEGGLCIGGMQVRLQNLRCPVLNIFALKDHLVPPSASVALGRYVGSADYSELSVDVGHIGMYVSSKARAEVPQAIARWLEARDA